jgi:transcriptional repressor of dcmA and dcmR
MSDDEALLDIKQAAQFLNVSETSLRRWTNEGRLACLRVGRRRERRFRRADLVAFMEQQPAATASTDQSRTSPTTHTLIAGVSVPHGTHLCGLYDNDVGRVRQTVSFLADGLGPGSACFLISPPSLRDGILEELERSRPSLDSDIEAGRLVVSEYASTARAQWDYFQRRFADAERAGVRSLRVVGDLWGIAKHITFSGVVEYEAGYSKLIAPRYPVVTLCQYDVREFGGAEVVAALKGHPDSLHYPPDRWLA